MKKKKSSATFFLLDGSRDGLARVGQRDIGDLAGAGLQGHGTRGRRASSAGRGAEVRVLQHEVGTKAAHEARRWVREAQVAQAICSCLEKALENLKRADFFFFVRRPSEW